jgi:hypothetical protein
VKCEQDEGVFVQLQSAEVGERVCVCGVDWSGIAGKRREREATTVKRMGGEITGDERWEGVERRERECV